MVPIIILSLFVARSVLAHPRHLHCKESYRSPGWPTAHTWNDFNTSIGGRLLTPLPPAVICDPSRAQYNSSQCAALGKAWPTTTFMNDDPLLLHQSNWQNDTCIPPPIYNGTNTCDLAPFAKYVVNASTSQHVVDAVRFANRHNLHISVKNTGHDYLGRSTSPDFQIWTHHLKGIQVHSNFKGKGLAITVHAGNVYGEIYNVTAKHNILSVGGAYASVGVGGHFTGGGHSPLGSLYGLAVDNALEMEVITPAGDLVTANEDENPDLFWAMRGGGGSTFGILISVTEKAYPEISSVSFALAFNSTMEEARSNNNTNFYSLLADMHAELIGWSDNYLNGYHAWGPASQISQIMTGVSATDSSSNGDPVPMGFLFNGWGLNQSISQTNTTTRRFQNMLNNTQGVTGVLELTPVPETNDLLNKQLTGPAGVNGHIASRLWDKHALLNRTGLLNLFRAVEPTGIRGIITSGPAVRNNALIKSTSVTPAWRRTYQHTAAGVGWEHGNTTAAAEAREKTTEILKILTNHATDMGAYINEADVEQPNAGEAFWGKENYRRLLGLKRELDPNGVFWCKPCIGWEDWDKMDDGRLCRRQEMEREAPFE